MFYSLLPNFSFIEINSVLILLTNLVRNLWFWRLISPLFMNTEYLFQDSKSKFNFRVIQKLPEEIKIP